MSLADLLDDFVFEEEGSEPQQNENVPSSESKNNVVTEGNDPSSNAQRNDGVPISGAQVNNFVAQVDDNNTASNAACDGDTNVSVPDSGAEGKASREKGEPNNAYVSDSSSDSSDSSDQSSDDEKEEKKDTKPSTLSTANTSVSSSNARPSGSSAGPSNSNAIASRSNAGPSSSSTPAPSASSSGRSANGFAALSSAAPQISTPSTCSAKQIVSGTRNVSADASSSSTVRKSSSGSVSNSIAASSNSSSSSSFANVTFPRNDIIRIDNLKEITESYTGLAITNRTISGDRLIKLMQGKRFIPLKNAATVAGDKDENLPAVVMICVLYSKSMARVSAGGKSYVQWCFTDLGTTSMNTLSLQLFDDAMATWDTNSEAKNGGVFGILNPHIYEDKKKGTGGALSSHTGRVTVGDQLIKLGEFATLGFCIAMKKNGEGKCGLPFDTAKCASKFCPLHMPKPFGKGGAGGGQGAVVRAPPRPNLDQQQFATTSGGGGAGRAPVIGSLFNDTSSFKGRNTFPSKGGPTSGGITSIGGPKKTATASTTATKKPEAKPPTIVSTFDTRRTAGNSSLLAAKKKDSKLVGNSILAAAAVLGNRTATNPLLNSNVNAGKGSKAPGIQRPPGAIPSVNSMSAVGSNSSAVKGSGKNMSSTFGKSSQAEAVQAQVGKGKPGQNQQQKSNPLNVVPQKGQNQQRALLGSGTANRNEVAGQKRPTPKSNINPDLGQQNKENTISTITLPANRTNTDGPLFFEPPKKSIYVEDPHPSKRQCFIGVDSYMSMAPPPTRGIIDQTSLMSSGHDVVSTINPQSSRLASIFGADIAAQMQNLNTDQLKKKQQGVGSNILQIEHLARCDERLNELEKADDLDQLRSEVKSMHVTCFYCNVCKVLAEHKKEGSAMWKCENELRHSVTVKFNVKKERYECGRCRRSEFVLDGRLPKRCVKCNEYAWKRMTFFSVKKVGFAKDEFSARGTEHEKAIEAELKRDASGENDKDAAYAPLWNSGDHA